jgi:hypothetical protein
MLEYITVRYGGYAYLMHNQTTAGPCVLFVNGTDASEYESVRNWLYNSRFQTYEAADIFDALEEMYDFMGSEMPNVIVVHGSEGADAMTNFVDDRCVMFSSAPGRPGCVKNLRQLADKLDTYFPPAAPPRHASA